MVVNKLTLKSFPLLAHPWIRPALFASIGLHVLLLLLPLPERSPAEDVDLAEVSQVQVTRLPHASAKLAPPAPTPTPLTPKAIAPSPVPKLVQPQRSVVRLPQPAKLPVKAPSAVTPTLAPSATPTPIVAETPVPSPDPGPPPALPFGDVPLLAGAEAGCFGIGVCHQLTDGTNFRAAGQTLESQLAAQGYKVTLRDDIEEAGRKVYELNKGNETRFLNVLSADIGTTVYLITPQPISLTDLQKSTSLKTELEATLDQLASMAANPTQFAQPEAFYANAVPRPETDGQLRFVTGNPPEQLLNALSTQLQAQDFKLTAAGGYGGGLLYEVNKGAYTAYLNLVPTIDRTGTVIVLWSALPS